MPQSPRALPIALLLSLTGAACGSDWTTPPAESAAGGSGGAFLCAGETAENPDAVGEGGAPAAPAPEYPRGLRVVGNRIEDSNANPIVLRGVNRSGTEYKCIQGGGFFDGDADERAVRAMASWPINAVRIPLNEGCWLSISGAPEAFSGENYKRAIKTYVALLHKHGLVPILDLHWAAPGDVPPRELWPMPNADHSAEFWSDVALTFMDDDGVVFEPYNEPFPARNSVGEEAWQCWRDGCQAEFRGTTYQAAGMQAMVDAIRSTGSTHVVLLGGVQYSNDLSGWLEYMPSDPLGNVGAAWHIYNFNACTDESCWNGAPAEVGAAVPVVATEIGQNDCQGQFITPLMQWLDARAMGYLAWSWNMLGPCVPEVRGPMGRPGRPWPLITDYCSVQPNSAYAQAFYDQLGLAP